MAAPDEAVSKLSSQEVRGIMTLVSLYHFWTRMPGGKRAHRYVVSDPHGCLWGIAWTRAEAESFARGGWFFGATILDKLPHGATHVGMIDWKRGA